MVQMTGSLTITRLFQTPPGSRGAAGSCIIDFSEMALIERCKVGDAAAWDTLKDRYETAVFRFAYSLSHSRKDADVIAHRVFLSIKSSIGTFRYESTFRSWLFQIIRKTYAERCVRFEYRKSVSVDSETHMEASCSIA
jgi:RNA polymerase sigma-70 factor (ECF subfamily)